jgi:hypothetical protein
MIPSSRYDQVMPGYKSSTPTLADCCSSGSWFEGTCHLYDSPVLDCIIQDHHDSRPYVVSLFRVISLLYTLSQKSKTHGELCGSNEYNVQSVWSTRLPYCFQWLHTSQSWHSCQWYSSCISSETKNWDTDTMFESEWMCILGSQPHLICVLPYTNWDLPW